MYAFIKTPDGMYKIYNHITDWQIIGPDGFERWFSVWNDNIKASLYRAVTNIPSSDYVDLCIC